VAHLAGFHSSIGFKLDPRRSREGIITVSGRIEHHHLNLNRVVHGGVYCTLLDTAMGAAVVQTLASDEITATTSLYVDFLRPARLGQVLTSQGTVTRRGRHIAFADGRIHDEDGRLLGSGRGTWYIWKKTEIPPAAPAPAARAPRPSRPRRR
jgi:uncharacterized protein (TIGR00369 family)